MKRAFFFFFDLLLMAYLLLSVFYVSDYKIKHNVLVFKAAHSFVFKEKAESDLENKICFDFDYFSDKNKFCYGVAYE